MAAFTLSSATRGSRLRFTVSGDLDLETAPELVADVADDVAAERPTSVVIDLTAVAFVDCAGLRALIELAAFLELRSLEWCFVPSPTLTHLVAITGSGHLFTFAPTNPEALVERTKRMPLPMLSQTIVSIFGVVACGALVAAVETRLALPRRGVPLVPVGHVRDANRPQRR
jgi:anti-anti-sigma factor